MTLIGAKFVKSLLKRVIGAQIETGREQYSERDQVRFERRERESERERERERERGRETERQRERDRQR